MENLGRITYTPELNKVWIRGHRADLYLSSIPLRPLQEAFNTLVEKIEGVSEGDIHLKGFYATTDAQRQFIEYCPGCLSAVIFPFKGEVARYHLNPRQAFFSNAHQNPDPLVIKGIESGIYLHATKRCDELWISGNEEIPNIIDGAVLFKSNPYENPARYPGFDQFIDYRFADPEREGHKRKIIQVNLLS